jgi:hypothetical protein
VAASTADAEVEDVVVGAELALLRDGGGLVEIRLEDGRFMALELDGCLERAVAEILDTCGASEADSRASSTVR